MEVTQTLTTHHRLTQVNAVCILTEMKHLFLNQTETFVSDSVNLTTCKHYGRKVWLNLVPLD